MVDDLKPPIDVERRRIVVRGARIVAIAAATTFTGACAASKPSKSELMYQNHRHDGKGCGDCKFFSATTSAGDAGQCAVVDGAVKRDGWCLAFSPNGSP